MRSSAMATERPIAVSTNAPFRLSRPLQLLIAAILLGSAMSGSHQVLYYWTHGPKVSDLRIFLTGVEMVRSGQSTNLYRFDAQEKTQIQLYPEAKRAGLLPFNHLAFELLFYWPLSRLPYRAALMTWAWLNVTLVFVVACLMKPHTEAIRRATGIPISAYILGFYPVLYVLGEGQDSLIFLLFVLLSWRCLEKGLTFLGGFLLALALFKFHLALAIAFFVFLLRRRWRALGGFAAGAVVVVGISRAIAGPGFAADYFSLLRKQEMVTPWGFVPWFMPNLRGFLQWALAPWLDIGSILPIIFVASLVVGVMTTCIVIRSHALEDQSLIYSAAMLSTLLVSYHLHMQDLSLAILPILFLLDQALQHNLTRPVVWLVTGAVAGLYLYRIAAVIVPILLIRGCVLAIPILLLWLACMSALRTETTLEQSPGNVL